MTLRTVLLSLQALLAAAEPDDPQDAVVLNAITNDIIFLPRVIQYDGLSEFKITNLNC
jgi:ubiquitin-protein ligase